MTIMMPPEPGDLWFSVIYWVWIPIIWIINLFLNLFVIFWIPVVCVLTVYLIYTLRRDFMRREGKSHGG